MTKSRKVLQSKLHNNLTKQIQERQKKVVNSFDVYENKRQKKIIPGQRIAGRNRNVAKARQMAIEKRSKTLLVEYSERDKQNSFKDSRFGETDPSMSIEEKMLRRFQEQRKKQSKKQVYNLEDESNQEDALTHYGQKLNENFDFNNNPDYDSDSDEENDKNSGFIRLENQAHFRDASDPNRPKTHKEIMMEIIQKSKERKEEKRKENEENEEMIFKLNNELDDIRELLVFRRDHPEVKVDNSDIKNYDEYDEDAKKLLLDQKAKASDRKKTAEEKAKEEYEKLQILETNRIKRMRGEIIENYESKGRKNRRNKRRKLDDEEEDEEENEIEGEDEEENENESDDEEGEENEIEGEDEENEIEGEKEGNEKSIKKSSTKSNEKDKPQTKNKLRIKRQEIINQAKNEMPYILNCPNSLEELYSLIEQYVRNDSDINDLIERIRTCTNIHLNNENKGKMMNFYNNLVQYCRDICSNLKDNDSNDSSSLLSSSYIVLITKQLFLIGQDYNNCPKTIFMKLLNELNLKLDKIISGNFIKNISTENKGTFLLSDLIIFKLIFDLFPVTDFNHPVVSSAMLIMCRSIIYSNIVSTCDIISLLFTMSLLLQYVKETKRIIPEIFWLLQNIVNLCFNIEKVEDVRFKDNENIKWLNYNTSQTKRKNISFILPLSFIDNTNIEESQEMKYKIYNAIFNIITESIDIYKENSCFIEYFTPIFESLNTIDQKNFKNINIRKQKKEINNRQPVSLQKEARKAEAIKEFEPEYEEEYIPGKNYDPNQQKAIEKQLKKQFKREQKGAARDLRKDSQYIAAIKENERKEQQQEKEKNRRRIETFLQEQQVSFKQTTAKKHAKTSGKEGANNVQT